MFMLHTIGFSADDMKDDVALAKRFVARFWTPEMQRFQPVITAVGEEYNDWEICVPRPLFPLDEILDYWLITEGLMPKPDGKVRIRFKLPNKAGTIVSITKNYKDNNDGRKSN